MTGSNKNVISIKQELRGYVATRPLLQKSKKKISGQKKMIKIENLVLRKGLKKFENIISMEDCYWDHIYFLKCL